MQASPDPLPPYASTLRIHLITQVGDTRFSVLTPSVIRMEHHAGCTTGGTTGGGGCFDDEVYVLARSLAVCGRTHPPGSSHYAIHT